MKSARTVLLISAVFFFSSCGFNSTNPSHTATAGGLGGAVVGAGTGAIIGSVIANGDVGMSALLGAGIGLPAGALVGYYYTATANERELGRLDGILEANQEVIDAEEASLRELRRQVSDESFLVQPDSSYREELYTGPTLGDPTR
ncbi:MAG: hypothetical protein KDD70_00730 [Bdellovibrionales bacterium]|nr:hypothetical protein [Bdellovibrionales bacterium]